MTEAEIISYFEAIEARLPQEAVSARIALSILLGEFARQGLAIERLEDELEKRPRLLLLQGGGA